MTTNYTYYVLTPLRVKHHSNSAFEIAKYLSGNEKIQSVIYPTLEDYPERALVKRQMGEMGGAIVALRFDGGLKAGRKFINSLGLIKCAVSLGDAETLIQHPASMTHGIYGPEEREKFGIDDDLLRIAVGLEDVDDLIADIDQATKAI